MANNVDTYDPKDITVTIAGRIITGFADDVVTVERETNQVEDEAGADGDVTRWITNDKRGTITVSLLPTSSDNAFLSALMIADEETGDGIFPMLIKDQRGLDLHAAPNAWVQQAPRMVYRKGVEAREWRFRTNRLQIFAGGAS